MTLLQETIDLCESQGEEFWETVWETASLGGHVIIQPDCVVVAWPDAPGTIFIWLCVGRGSLKKLCHLVPVGTRWLKWQRGLRLADRAEVGQFDFARVKRLAGKASLSASHHEFRIKTQSGPGGEHSAAGYGHN